MLEEELFISLNLPNILILFQLCLQSNQIVYILFPFGKERLRIRAIREMERL